VSEIISGDVDLLIPVATNRIPAADSPVRSEKFIYSGTWPYFIETDDLLNCSNPVSALIFCLLILILILSLYLHLKWGLALGFSGQNPAFQKRKIN
jgi:hypothetical protein